MKLDLVSQSLICKCEKTYCGLHRAAEAHTCSYNYRQEGKENLLKIMSTVVVARKVDII